MAKRPKAWLHTIHYEGSQTDTRVTLDGTNPWGVPGKDYAGDFAVTSETLVLRSDYEALQAKYDRLKTDFDELRWRMDGLEK